MLKSIMRSPVFAVVLFVVAAGLLLFGAVNAVQAAPRVQSNDYQAEVELSSIQTALVEDGNVVEGDDALLTKFPADGSQFAVGKTYDYSLAVRNTGSADEYVRVTVTRYWEKDGKKAVELSPDLIDLHFVEGGWKIDSAATTPERTVLYYASPVAAGGETTPFTDTLRIDGKVLSKATKLADGSFELDYEGLEFRIKVVADAVQTHNGEEAMTSAWGHTI